MSDAWQWEPHRLIYRKSWDTDAWWPDPERPQTHERLWVLHSIRICQQVVTEEWRSTNIVRHGDGVGEGAHHQQHPEPMLPDQQPEPTPESGTTSGTVRPREELDTDENDEARSSTRRRVT